MIDQHIEDWILCYRFGYRVERIEYCVERLDIIEKLIYRWNRQSK